jgi:negative elongation factor C/D
LLVRHPLAIQALLGHLFQSGPSRITAASKKNKCARLVALATLAAQDLAKAEATKLGTTTHDNGDRGDDSPDEVALTRMILQGSQLCENLETMISFLVTTDQPGTSPGEKLCSLALQCPPVGLGVVIWARAFTAGADYAASASFPTLSSSILSLVRLVAMRYPFAREYALHVALAFLRHSNSDVSYVKVNLIKEHSLRLLLFLLVQGEVVPVLSKITARLQSNNSELDSSLVRYFVAGVLEVVRPPVSPVFVRLFGGLLREPRAVDAVKSNYFAATNRKRLETMLRSFENVRLYDGAPLGKEEQLLVASLLSAYQVV